MKFYITNPVLIFNVLNECDFNPCLNAGTCVNRIAGFQCYCERGFQCPTCAIGKKVLLLKLWKYLPYSCLLFVCIFFC